MGVPEKVIFLSICLLILEAVSLNEIHKDRVDVILKFYS